jgi:hypothetical protein
VDAWSDFAFERSRKFEPEYWERRLRGERRWRHLRNTVDSLCAQSGPLRAAPSPATVLADYSWDHSFATRSFADDLGQLSACQQYALEDYLLLQGPVRQADLQKLVRAYWMRHGQWTTRIRSVANEIGSLIGL